MTGTALNEKSGKDGKGQADAISVDEENENEQVEDGDEQSDDRSTSSIRLYRCFIEFPTPCFGAALRGRLPKPRTRTMCRKCRGSVGC